MSDKDVSITLPPAILKKYISSILVETGTFDGRTVQMALDCGFPEIRSVETDDALFAECVARFDGDSRVKLWHGDSTELLWSMIHDIDQPVTFWIDAHIQESYKYGRKRVPLLDELDIISSHPIKNHTIMVDDKRIMGTPAWHGIGVHDVVSALKKINPLYKIVYEDSNAARGDIFVAMKR